MGENTYHEEHHAAQDDYGFDDDVRRLMNEFDERFLMDHVFHHHVRQAAQVLEAWSARRLSASERSIATTSAGLALLLEEEVRRNGSAPYETTSSTTNADAIAKILEITTHHGGESCYSEGIRAIHRIASSHLRPDYVIDELGNIMRNARPKVYWDVDEPDDAILDQLTDYCGCPIREGPSAIFPDNRWTEHDPDKCSQGWSMVTEVGYRPPPEDRRDSTELFRDMILKAIELAEVRNHQPSCALHSGRHFKCDCDQTNYVRSDILRKMLNGN